MPSSRCKQCDQPLVEIDNYGEASSRLHWMQSLDLARKQTRNQIARSGYWGVEVDRLAAVWFMSVGMTRIIRSAWLALSSWEKKSGRRAGLSFPPYSPREISPPREMG